MKKVISILYPLLIMGGLILFMIGCKKDNTVSQIPVVTTTAISNIASTTATSGGSITSDGGATITARGVCWSTNQTPTIANSKTSDGTGTGTFTSSITGLTANTTYYVRAYATNSVGTAYGSAVSFTTLQVNNNTGTVTDKDGNTYNTVTIGTQTWMAANLNVTTYNDGTTIPNVTNPNIWDTLITGAVCTYNNTTNADTINTYGRLYNWYAVNTGKLCPTGWHVPSDAEWTTLQTYLIANGYNYDGSTSGNYIAKSMASTTGWASDSYTGDIGNNPSTNNKSGFTALPGGCRGNGGAFSGVGYVGYWWSSTEGSTSGAYGRSLGYYGSDLYGYGYDGKVIGFSVRCLRN